MARHWAAWAAASIVAHAAILAGLFWQLPLPVVSARASTVSVQLVAMAPTHVTPTPTERPVHQPESAHARRASERMRERPQALARAVAGLTRPAEAAHARRSAAMTKPSKAPSPAVATATSPSLPSALAEVSAHEMNLVRRHLERFKFYPLSARRRGIGGDVEVGFRLTAGGKAEQVRVLATSGHDILDEAALQTVSRAQPFPVDDGQYRVHLRFRSL